MKKLIAALSLAAATFGMVGVTAASASTVPAPHIVITSFGPSGHNVEVTFQDTNNTSTEQRFVWAQFVLKAPGGSKHTAYRVPGTAPYQFVDGYGGMFADGGIFQFPKYVPGTYAISYGGKVLQTKTL